MSYVTDHASYGWKVTPTRQKQRTQLAGSILKAKALLRRLDAHGRRINECD